MPRQPGSFDQLGQAGPDWVAKRFADLETRIRELAAANSKLQVALGALTMQTGQWHADASGIEPSNTPTTVLSVTVDVPVGFTTARVLASANFAIRNTTASQDALDVSLWIDGASVGYGAYFDTAAGFLATPSVSNSRLLSSVSGSFTVAAAVSTVLVGGATWTSSGDGFDVGNLDVLVQFSR